MGQRSKRIEALRSKYPHLTHEELRKKERRDFHKPSHKKQARKPKARGGRQLTRS